MIQSVGACRATTISISEAKGIFRAGRKLAALCGGGSRTAPTLQRSCTMRSIFFLHTPHLSPDAADVRDLGFERVVANIGPRP
jgi:transposase